MAASAYSSKDGRIKELVTFVFPYSVVAITSVKGGRFLPLILGDESQKDGVTFREYDHSVYLRKYHILLLPVVLRR